MSQPALGVPGLSPFPRTFSFIFILFPFSAFSPFTDGFPPERVPGVVSEAKGALSRCKGAPLGCEGAAAGSALALPDFGGALPNSHRFFPSWLPVSRPRGPPGSADADAAPFFPPPLSPVPSPGQELPRYETFVFADFGGIVNLENIYEEAVAAVLLRAAGRGER